MVGLDRRYRTWLLSFASLLGLFGLTTVLTGAHDAHLAKTYNCQGRAPQEFLEAHPELLKILADDRRAQEDLDEVERVKAERRTEAVALGREKPGEYFEQDLEKTLTSQRELSELSEKRWMDACLRAVGGGERAQR